MDCGATATEVESLQRGRANARQETKVGGGDYKLSNRIRGWPPLCHSERAIKRNARVLCATRERDKTFLRLPPPSVYNFPITTAPTSLFWWFESHTSRWDACNPPNYRTRLIRFFLHFAHTFHYTGWCTFIPFWLETCAPFPILLTLCTRVCI